MLFLKTDSNSEHFSFFVFYFKVPNEISNFQEFSTPSPLFQPPFY